LSIGSNIKWVMLAQVIRFSAQFLSIFFLSKILSPDDFGVMAAVMTVVNFSNLIRDFGSSSAIIRAPSLDNKKISLIFTINIIMGFLLTAIVYLSAEEVGRFYKSPGIVSLLKLIAIIFLVNNIGAVHQALLERKNEFKKVVLVEAFATVSSLLIAVVGAINGFGVTALAFQILVYAGLTTVIFSRISGWKFSFSSNFKDGEDIFKFSGWLFSFNIVNYFSRNYDSIIIGKKLTLLELGSYGMSNRIISIPLQGITLSINRALLPIFSQLSGDNATLRKNYLEIISGIAFFSGPIMALICLTGEPVVKLVLSDKWKLVPHILNYMCAIAFIQTLANTAGGILMAKGQTKILFYLGVFGALLFIAAFTIGINFGLDGFLWSYLVAQLINSTIAFSVVMKEIGGSLRSLLSEIFETCITVVSSIFLYKYLSVWLEFDKITNQFILASLESILFLFTYISLYFIIFRKVFLSRLNSILG